MKKLIKKVLPLVLVEKMRQVRMNYIGFQANFPITQIYINDEISSVVGINNFFSTLQPLADIRTVAKVVFYNQLGEILLKKKVNLKHWASSFLRVDEIFKENKISSNLGMVTVQIVPKLNLWDSSFLKFGLLSSHFFMFYKSKDERSMAHMHPLSPLDPNNIKDDFFQTSQRIEKNDLAHIKLYQLNPSLYNQVVSYTFKSDAGEEIVRSITVFSKGVEVITFSPDEFQDKKFEKFYFSISPLPSSNAKPMLMRVFKNGLFSMSHC